MKVLIFCGGLGTRMKEETEFKPKPMVLIGGKPILWHIMKIYAHHGFNEFVLTLGYKGDYIKNFFLDQKHHLNDFTLNTHSHEVTYHGNNADRFNITFAETGLESLTGKRILLSSKYIGDEGFMATYGDGVSDINVRDILAFHKKQGTVGTISGFHPHSKYGLIKMNEAGDRVLDFAQKPLMYDYISGGFMVFEKKALDYFDEGLMEQGLLRMAKDNQLSLFKHEGFWKAMDTYHEMEELNNIWNTARPWAVWEKKHEEERAPQVL